jgi:hypothetical protein
MNHLLLWSALLPSETCVLSDLTLFGKDCFVPTSGSRPDTEKVLPDSTMSPTIFVGNAAQTCLLAVCYPEYLKALILILNKLVRKDPIIRGVGNNLEPLLPPIE